MSLADKLENEMGEGSKPTVRRVARPAGGEGIFALANAVPTTEVMDRLGLAHENTDRGVLGTCPGCGEDGAMVGKNGGLKCLHDRCKSAGPRDHGGFRTNVDLVTQVHGVQPLDAAKQVCQWFGIEVPTRDDAPTPPPGRFEEDAAAEPPPDPFADRFRFLDEGSLLNKPPARHYLLKRGAIGVLPLGKAAMLVGAGGVGKTLLECQLALSVALGVNFLGSFNVAAPGPVLLALAEEELEEVHRRLHAAAMSLGLSREERIVATRKIVALPMAGTNVALTSGDGKGNVETTPARDWLFKHLDESGVDWRLLILDPLSRWAGNDVEKDAHAATRFVETVEGLTKVRGNPTVLVAHHSNKLARRADAPISGTEASRGSSALTDGFRWVANLDPEGSHVVLLRITKNNYAPPTDPVYLLRDTDHGGALRPMSADELDDHSAQQAPKQSGRARVSDEEIDARIRAVVDQHGPQASVRALKRCGVKGEDSRVYARAIVLGAIPSAER